MLTTSFMPAPSLPSEPRMRSKVVRTSCSNVTLPLSGGSGTPIWPETKIQQPACVSMRSASLKLGAIGLGRCLSKSMALLPMILLFSVCTGFNRCRLPLPSTASDPVFYVNRDGPAGIVERLSHLFPDGVPRRLGHGRQQLAGGRTAALEGAIIGVERRQHKGGFLGAGLEVHEPSLTEQRFKPSLVAECEKPCDSIGQAGFVPRYDNVDPEIIGTLRRYLDGDSRPSAWAQHTMEAGEAPRWLGEEHKTKAAYNGIEARLGKAKRLSILDRDGCVR